jgi:hypothetical protein
MGYNHIGLNICGEVKVANKDLTMPIGTTLLIAAITIMTYHFGGLELVIRVSVGSVATAAMATWFGVTYVVDILVTVLLLVFAWIGRSFFGYRTAGLTEQEHEDKGLALFGYLEPAVMLYSLTMGLAISSWEWGVGIFFVLTIMAYLMCWYGPTAQMVSRAKSKRKNQYA